MEPLDISKIHDYLEWGGEGLNVSISEIETRANLHFFDGISTVEIEDILIKTVVDMGSLRYMDYDKMAEKLLVSKTYKLVFNNTIIPHHLSEQIEKGIEANEYLEELDTKFSNEEKDFLDSMIVHNRDFDFSYIGLYQLIKSYTRTINGKIFESPQHIFMLISMATFWDYPKETRMRWIVEMYNSLSTFKISLPTPAMSSLRTKNYDIASCVLIKTPDSIKGWTSSSTASILHTVKNAGIGWDVSSLASIGDEVKNGRIKHAGKVPYLKLADASINSSRQSNRRGSSTIFINWFDPEILNIISLKSPRVSVDKRINDLKYGVKINQTLFDRAVKDEYVHLFSTRSKYGKELEKYFYEDQDKFNEYYKKMVDEKTYTEKISARELLSNLVRERAEVGIIYPMFIDEHNSNTPFKEPIYQSNLCVSGDTKILTKKGYENISNLEGSEVECWNGEEWSKTRIEKTSNSSKLIEVVFDNGSKIKCTEYHRFPTIEMDKHGGRKKYPVIKKAKELVIGDKLEKFGLDCCFNGTNELYLAYENGLFTADGTIENKSSKRIAIYESKIKLLSPNIKGFKVDRGVTQSGSRKQTKQEFVFHTKDLEDKYFVPNTSYSIKSRLDWFSGYLDGDGCLLSNKGSQTIQAVSTNHNFLQDVRLMLQEIGVHSTVIKREEDGFRKLPNSNGDYEDYWCESTSMISIAGKELNKLLDLGFKGNRVTPHYHEYNRDARRFPKVIEINNIENKEPTFCGREPKKDRLMLNGVVTMNCMEISLPTKDLEDVNGDDGAIAVCVLSNINQGKVNEEELPLQTELLVRALNNIIFKQNHPTNQAQSFVRDYRALGIGFSNHAYWLANQGLKYGQQEALDKHHEWMEAFQYNLIKASVTCAKEYSIAPNFKKTKWSDGTMPIDRYKKTVDELSTIEYKQDWDSLRKDVLKYGMFNSCLSSVPPSEKSSITGNQTSSIEGIKDLVTPKDNGGMYINQYAPEALRLFDKYDFVYRDGYNADFIKHVAITKKFLCQQVSANAFYKRNEDGKIKEEDILKDLFMAKYYGVGGLYYHNTETDDVNVQDDCISGGCNV